MAKDLSEITISRKLVREQVARRVWRDPGTITCAGLGALLLAGGTIAGAGLGATVAGGVLIPAGFLLNYKYRHARFAKEFMDEVAEALARKRQRRLGEIRADLYDLANDIPAKEEAGDLAARALRQFGQIHEKFDLFMEVLDRKLHPGELAHARYLGTADRFFMKIMEHLSRTSDVLRAAWHSEDDESRRAHIETVKKLLSRNSEALSAFDQTVSGMTSIKDRDAVPAEDLQSIKEQLDQLARQARRFGEL